MALHASHFTLHSSQSVAVFIMAKAPRPGAVKTRLGPVLSPEDAAEIARAFLLDKIEQLKTLERATPAIAHAPASERRLFEELAPGVDLIPQEGEDLGARLANSFEQFLAKGYAGALAVDADTPTLPQAFLQRAVDLIRHPEVDLVLGPTEDGGYYLIGLRKLYRELFQEMTWSTAEVLPETIRRAETLGLRVGCLPAWFDIDTPDDLARLERSLQQHDGHEPRHTRRFFLDRAQ